MLNPFFHYSITKIAFFRLFAIYLLECGVEFPQRTARLVELVDTTDLKSVGFLPCRFESGSGYILEGRLAQLVEQLTFNQLVIGSNPIAPTTHNDICCY